MGLQTSLSIIRIEREEQVLERSFLFCFVLFCFAESVIGEPFCLLVSFLFCFVFNQVEMSPRWKQGNDCGKMERIIRFHDILSLLCNSLSLKWFSFIFSKLFYCLSTKRFAFDALGKINIFTIFNLPLPFL